MITQNKLLLNEVNNKSEYTKTLEHLFMFILEFFMKKNESNNATTAASTTPFNSKNASDCFNHIIDKSKDLFKDIRENSITTPLATLTSNFSNNNKSYPMLDNKDAYNNTNHNNNNINNGISNFSFNENGSNNITNTFSNYNNNSNININNIKQEDNLMLPDTRSFGFQSNYNSNIEKSPSLNLDNASTNNLMLNKNLSGYSGNNFYNNFNSYNHFDNFFDSNELKLHSRKSSFSAVPKENFSEFNINNVPSPLRSDAGFKRDFNNSNFTSNKNLANLSNVGNTDLSNNNKLESVKNTPKLSRKDSYISNEEVLNPRQNRTKLIYKIENEDSK